MTESQILEIARQLDRASVGQFLRAICGSDRELLRRIEQTLQSESRTTKGDDSGTVWMSSQDSSNPELVKSPVDSRDHSGGFSDADDHFSVQQEEPLSGSFSVEHEQPGFDSLCSGRWIGPYQLIDRLGRGGMGDVWRALQTEPVHREVALKVIKSGMNSRQILARFAAEQRALALMNHPFIAKILDAGATPEGHPFFAMELVSGTSLTAFCDQNKLSIEDRLKLFVDVCRGVQHAHQKGIVHRDLKPGNILVTVEDGRPVPRIIDFGLFKATGDESRIHELSLQTNIGQILGTLKYMSPEQAGMDGMDVDTRTDIYALGVILYELLTGSAPLDDPAIKGQAALRVLEFIRERDPVKPSSKLSSSTDEQRSDIFRCRQTDSARLSRALVGDLDWIVMKALEKDRSRRYDSAAGFAEDVVRFLANEPVMARPPSLFYRVNKFARKNRVAVVAGILLFASLVAGMVGTTMGLREAIQARDSEADARKAETIAKQRESRLRVVAEQRQQIAELARARELEARIKAERRSGQIESINNAVFDIFTDFDLEETRANEDPVETVLGTRLAEMGARLDESVIEDPVVLSSLLDRLGRTLNSLGLSEEAVEFLEKGLELRRQHAGEIDELTLSSRGNLAAALRAIGQIDRALPLYEQVVQQRVEVNGEDDPATLTGMSNLALGYGAAGKYEDAILLLTKVLEKRQKVLGLDHEDTVASMRNLATGYLKASQPKKAVELLEEVYKLLGLESENVDLDSVPLNYISAINSLAAAYEEVGQIDRALPLFERALQIYRRRLGKDHPTTLGSLNNLAYVCRSSRQFSRAIGLLNESVELSRAKYGEKHQETLLGKAELGAAFLETGEQEKALSLLVEVLDEYRQRLGNLHPKSLAVMGNLGAAFRSVNRHEEAFSLFEEAYNGYRETLGDDNPLTINSLNNLAAGYLNSGRLEEAIPMFERALEVRRRVLGPDHPMTIVSSGNMGAVYARAGKIELAIPLLEEVLDVLTRQLGTDHPEVNKRAAVLAGQYRDLARFDKAIPLMQKVLDWREAEFGPEHPETLNMMNSLAAAFWANRQFDKSVPLLEDTLTRMEESLGRDDPVTQATVANLGVNYRDVDRTADALPLLEEAFQASLQVPSMSWVGPQLLMAEVQAGEKVKASELARQLIETARSANEADSVPLASQLLAISRATILIEGFGETPDILQECVEILQSQRPDEWICFDAMSLQGQELLNRNNPAAAAPLLESSFAGLQVHRERMPPIYRTALPRTASQLVQLYRQIDEPDQVAKWQSILDDLGEMK